MVRRAFPHSESPPRGPSGAYHLGKHFLSTLYYTPGEGMKGLFVLWGYGRQGNRRFLRRATFQVISNISHFFCVWFGKPLRCWNMSSSGNLKTTPVYSRRSGKFKERRDETQICPPPDENISEDSYLLQGITCYYWLIIQQAVVGQALVALPEMWFQKIPPPQILYLIRSKKEIYQGRPQDFLRFPSIWKESGSPCAVFRKMS